MLLARTEEEKPQEGRDEIFFRPRVFLVGLFGEFCPHVAVWKEEEEER